ncbi:hypothetical protein [Enterococcus casseliflavus]|uniref:hypothetical protein n=1 Tax=Enterococcus casseliflavus TaxID=37734 RepID=UPI0034D17FE9
MKSIIEGIEKVILSIPHSVTVIFYSFIITLIAPNLTKDVIIFLGKLLPDFFIQYLDSASITQQDLLTIWNFLILLFVISLILICLSDSSLELTISHSHLFYKTFTIILNLNMFIGLCLGIYARSFKVSFWEIFLPSVNHPSTITFQHIIIVVGSLLQFIPVFFIYLMPFVTEIPKVIDNTDWKSNKKNKVGSIYAIATVVLLWLLILAFSQFFRP